MKIGLRSSNKKNGSVKHVGDAAAMDHIYCVSANLLHKKKLQRVSDRIFSLCIGCTNRGFGMTKSASCNWLVENQNRHCGWVILFESEILQSFNS